MIFFITALLAHTAQGSNPQKNQHTYTSEIGQNHSATIKLTSNNYYLHSESESTLLKEATAIHLRGDEVIFLDVNSDELKDIFVKIMDARVEGYYTLYLSSIENNKLSLTEQPAIFGSPYIDDSGLLISVMHDGPFSHIEKYNITSSRPYRVESRTPINHDLEKVVTYDQDGLKTGISIKLLGSNIDAKACITSKSHFHASPDEGKKKSYLIEGDTVLLRDATKNGKWFNVFYPPSKSSGWIQENHLTIDCLSTGAILGAPLEQEHLLSSLLSADGKQSYKTALPTDILEEARNSVLKDLDDDGIPEVLVPLTANAVNACVAAFRYAPTTKDLQQIDFAGGALCSPSRKGRFLISKYRSEGRWIEDIYAIENREFKIVISDSCLDCNWVFRKEYRNDTLIDSYLVSNAPSFKNRSKLLGAISAASTIIYKAPDKNTSSNFSLRQGDTISIKNIENRDDQYFVEIESSDTQKIIGGWIECEALVECDSL